MGWDKFWLNVFTEKINSSQNTPPIKRLSETEIAQVHVPVILFKAKFALYHNRIQNTRLYDYILTIINWPKDLEKTSRNLSLELWTNEIDSVWKL